MAEHSFQEVMRQFDRMCKAHAGCLDCPLAIKGSVETKCSIGSFIDESEYVEREVMTWAAENPEPVYPTWGQYFRRYYGLEYCKGHEMLLENIPADLARKLGIEPKEG